MKFKPSHIINVYGASDDLMYVAVHQVDTQGGWRKVFEDEVSPKPICIDGTLNIDCIFDDSKGWCQMVWFDRSVEDKNLVVDHLYDIKIHNNDCDYCPSIEIHCNYTPSIEGVWGDKKSQIKDVIATQFDTEDFEPDDILEVLTFLESEGMIEVK